MQPHMQQLIGGTGDRYPNIRKLKLNYDQPLQFLQALFVDNFTEF